MAAVLLNSSSSIVSRPVLLLVYYDHGTTTVTVEVYISRGEISKRLGEIIGCKVDKISSLVERGFCSNPPQKPQKGDYIHLVQFLRRHCM